MSTTEIELEEAGPVGSKGVDDIDDIDDLDELEDLDDIDGGEDALDDDSLDDDDDEVLGSEVEVLDAVDVVTDGVELKVVKVAPPADPATEAETDDDDGLADEVEASLDVILAERLRGSDTEVDEEVEDDEEEDDGAPNQLATVIPVRRPDEFLCQSCFLLKPPGQLADRDHQLCRDCA